MKALSTFFLVIFFVGCTKEDGVNFTEYTTTVHFIIYRENCDQSAMDVTYAIRNERGQMELIDTTVFGDFALTIPFTITKRLEEIPLTLKWESNVAAQTVTQIICNGKSVASNRDGNCRFGTSGSTWCNLDRYYDPPE